MLLHQISILPSRNVHRVSGLDFSIQSLKPEECEGLKYEREESKLEIRLKEIHVICMMNLSFGRSDN